MHEKCLKSFCEITFALGLNFSIILNFKKKGKTVLFSFILGNHEETNKILQTSGEMENSEKQLKIKEEQGLKSILSTVFVYV